MDFDLPRNMDHNMICILILSIENLMNLTLDSDWLAVRHLERFRIPYHLIIGFRIFVFRVRLLTHGTISLENIRILRKIGTSTGRDSGSRLRYTLDNMLVEHIDSKLDYLDSRVQGIHASRLFLLNS